MNKRRVLRQSVSSSSGKQRILETIYHFRLSLLSGILLVVIQPPISLFPLAFVALVPLLMSLDKNDLKYSFLSGYVAGVVSYLGLIYWVVVAMNHYGGLGAPVSTIILLLFVLYLSLYTGFFAFLCAWMERMFSIPLYISAPLIWVLLEYGRGFVFTGFPWSFLAHSQYNFLVFIQIAAITGTYFISYLIMAVNVSVLSYIRNKRLPVMYTSFAMILLALSFAYGVVSLTEKTDASLETAIVQGNIRQDAKWDDAFKAVTIKKYVEMTLKEAHDTDLTIWPETAMPFIFERELLAARHIRALPPLTGSALLFGAVSMNDADRFQNSAYLIEKNGIKTGVYHKVHLVPFGEYTPFLSYFPFLKELTAAGGDFAPGDGHVPIKTDIGAIGLLICYEGVFPSIAVDTVRRGAHVLVNLTNDAWYDRTSAPFQHFAFYVFRAIETDRYLLRAANTGISAIIDPKGRTVAKTRIFVENVLKGHFGMKNTQTFYVRFGDYFIILSLLWLAVAMFTGWRSKSTRPAP